MNKRIIRIEILIVAFIVLINIISNFGVVSSLNSKARDIQVLSEIDQIRSGLELFLLANNFYPEATEPLVLNDVYLGTEKLCLTGFEKLTQSCEKNILRPIPNQDLVNGNIYTYKSTDNNQNYQIEFTLKTNFKKQGLLKGVNCATNLQITSQACF